jgi:hypothetical protein
MSNKIGTETTEREVKQLAKEAVDHKISELIQPSDIDESATEWEDIDRYTVEKECHESTEIMLKEQQGPFYGMIRDYAIILWRDGMERINLDSDLVSDGITERECLTVYGKWPYSMSYFEVYQVLSEYINETHIHQIPNACYNEAKETVSIGIVNGMLPDCRQGEN